jgi:hypothetical protein
MPIDVPGDALVSETHKETRQRLFNEDVEPIIAYFEPALAERRIFFVTDRDSHLNGAQIRLKPSAPCYSIVGEAVEIYAWHPAYAGPAIFYANQRYNGKDQKAWPEILRAVCQNDYNRCVKEFNAANAKQRPAPQPLLQKLAGLFA